jgi:hypothetical protein
MKFFIFFLCIYFLCSSCRFFETEKISSETFYEEEFKTIEWNEIDQYPTFSTCKELTDKIDQRNCFVNTLSNKFYQSIQDQKWTIMKTIHDTIKLDISVSNSGEIQINRIEIDSLLGYHFPNMSEVLTNSIDSLSLFAPAYKRGIPVNTRFILPIVLNTE